MKKNTVLLVLLAAVFVAIAITLPQTPTTGEELIRIHIRANSNENTDQTVKYAVRDAVTDYLVPYLAHAKDRNDAYVVLNQHLKNIEGVVNTVLRQHGFSYSAKAVLINEYFPARQYGDTLVENGYYDALIIELGNAAGNNWWCVVYPPLCFVDATTQNSIKYKSKLKELVDKWRGQ